MGPYLLGERFECLPLFLTRGVRGNVFERLDQLLIGGKQPLRQAERAEGLGGRDRLLREFTGKLRPGAKGGLRSVLEVAAQRFGQLRVLPGGIRSRCGGMGPGIRDCPVTGARPRYR